MVWDVAWVGADSSNDGDEEAYRGKAEDSCMNSRMESLLLSYFRVWVPDLLERNTTIVHADSWYEIELNKSHG